MAQLRKTFPMRVPLLHRKRLCAAAKSRVFTTISWQCRMDLIQWSAERGTRLSGGQKQRIAIARAILRNSPILILDEATASVDVETESQIQQAISELAGTRTIIAIAHRLSTVRRADVILVFSEGKIVQRGTHEQLIAQNGIYRRMWSVQELSSRAV